VGSPKIKSPAQEAEGPVMYRFALYIIGSNASGQHARQNLESICREYLTDNYSIEIVDLESSTGAVPDEQVLAIPMVVRKAPLPEVRIIGDLSNRGLAVNKLLDTRFK
jgi:circadian clock protein KaiB